MGKDAHWQQLGATESELRKDKRINDLVIGSSILSSLVGGFITYELLSNFEEKTTAEKIIDLPLGAMALIASGVALRYARKQWKARKLIKRQLRSAEQDREIEEEYKLGLEEIKRSERAAWKMIQDEEDEGPPLK